MERSSTVSTSITSRRSTHSSTSRCERRTSGAMHPRSLSIYRIRAAGRETHARWHGHLHLGTSAHLRATMRLVDHDPRQASVLGSLVQRRHEHLRLDHLTRHANAPVDPHRPGETRRCGHRRGAGTGAGGKKKTTVQTRSIAFQPHFGASSIFVTGRSNPLGKPDYADSLIQGAAAVDCMR